MDKTIVKEKVNDEAVMPETDTQVEIIKKTTTSPLSVGLWIGLIIAMLALVGVSGYYAGKNTGGGITPTPTVSALPIETALPTETPTATTTATAIPSVTTTPTASPTPTPTAAWVTKTANIKEWENSFTLKFTLVVPPDVTVTEGKVSSWNGIILRKGTKNFMAFNLPYELYEIQGYSSITNVSSTNIANLKRVRSKKVFGNSGSYSFAVAYVTPGSLLSGTDCTAPVISDATTSPCAMPALTYGSGIGFGAYCSIDPTYLTICDRVMKTIKVVKL
ncbi:hypothetical protein COZ14_03810 [Candidatus Dojkabacteria bacterium CG_4_10_14_3_um_filter_Dojkabacteria_WS6_41_9]|nr:MAG: hypothetical protein COZ14_03810 [Candidatus Dojkabacteria bacterium CG_4_10_14_3_um_filter_Dojkabacteria_WS6_41_9]